MTSIVSDDPDLDEEDGESSMDHSGAEPGMIAREMISLTLVLVR